jgi:hypothetical protein
MDKADRSARTHYDLYIRDGSATFYFRNDNHGMTLTAKRMSWTWNSRHDGADYTDISAVHLQSGGDWTNPLSFCRITFTDGETLLVSNANDRGLPDDAQRPLYREFVYDFHTRLAGLPQGTISFTAGLQGFRYQLIIACGVLLGIISIGVPVIAMIATKSFGPLSVLFAGVGLYWPLVKSIEKNSPRSYDPRDPPAELLG